MTVRWESDDARETRIRRATWGQIASKLKCATRDLAFVAAAQGTLLSPEQRQQLEDVRVKLHKLLRATGHE